MPQNLSPPPPGGSRAQPKVRRRNRIITSCLECRRRKLKCDRANPCNHCIKGSRDCVFLAPSFDHSAKNKLSQFKDSVESLEKGLEEQVGDHVAYGWSISSQSKPALGNALTRDTAGEEHLSSDERYLKTLEPSPLAIPDVIYGEDGDEMIDELGVMLGKVKVTERIGGFIRPNFADELDDTMRVNPEIANASPSLGNLDVPADSVGASPAPSWDTSYYTNASPEYALPSLSLFFSGSYEDVNIINFLPSKDFADRLINHYWIAVHLIARVVHRPTFEKQYAEFWMDVSQGFEPSPSLQALIFAALFSAAVSLSEEDATTIYGCNRDDMIQTFRNGCEFALSRSNLLKTTKVKTFQALIMYLIPLCRVQTSRSHAALVGMTIRLAECAGFHRDGTTFGLPPVQVHVRRLIWYQLSYLDVRTVEAAGARPYIRPEEFETRLPLNVEDTELEGLLPPKNDAARWTDMTLSRIRFESYEVLRAIWIERPRLDKGEASITDLLRRVEEFRGHTSAKYLPMLNENVPVQRFASRLIYLLINKMRTAILHRYALAAPVELPEKLFNIMWSAGLAYLEACVEFDSNPEFETWKWYLGAHNQWHLALLYLALVARNFDRPHIDRVWACLDYIFEYPSDMTRPEKIKWSFMKARYQVDEHQRQRKHQIPTSLAHSINVSKESARRDSIARKQSSSPPVTETTSAMAQNQTSTTLDYPNMFDPPPAGWNLSEATHYANISSNAGIKTKTSSPPFSLANGSSNTVYNDRLQQAQNTAQDSSVHSTATSPIIGPTNPFPEINWDELDQLFPVGQIPDFNNQTMPESGSFAAGMPPATYFPAPGNGGSPGV